MNKTIKFDLIPEYSKIKWKNETWKVKDLKEYSRNPRILMEKGLKQLNKSISRFNLVIPLVINTDGTICGGHGRLKILKKMGIKEVDVRIPEETLNNKDFADLNISLNKAIAGIFDMDMLSTDYDYDELIEHGFEPYELGIDTEDSEDEKDSDSRKVKKKKTCPECGCEF